MSPRDRLRLEPSTTLRCPVCRDRQGQRRFIGETPEPVVVTGLVARVELVPHASAGGGCGYSQCGTCRQFVRYEVVPPSAKVA